MAIRVFEAGPDAGGAVEALLAAQFDEHSIRLAPELLRTGVRGLLGEPQYGFVLLGEYQERNAGLACVSFIWMLEHGGKSAWLDELYVVPELRALGLGTRLLRAACERAAKAGCAAVDLEVDADHERASRLYRREGFLAHRRARWVKPLREEPSVP